MHKIWIILKSEFWRRATSKGFLLTTFLAPLGILAFGALVGGLTFFAFESGTQTIAVVDKTGHLSSALEKASDQKMQFVQAAQPVDSLRRGLRDGTYDGYLLLPASLLNGTGEATYYSDEGSGLTTQLRLSRLLDKAVKEQRLAAQNASPDLLRILRTNVEVRPMKLTNNGAAADRSQVNAIIGYLMGFIVYMTVFIYGGHVMQGIIEEKANRVVEVVVSSVRPFQLLMGKVLGIGALGLVQVILWGLLLFTGLALAGSATSLFLNPAALDLPSGASQEAMLKAADVTLPSLAPSVFIWFIFFFLGGYLLYASLFAAAGSAVEQQQDAQGFVAPLTAFAIAPMALIPLLVQNPNATLSVTLSLIPFFSPILMIVRLAIVDVPLWQTLLSYALLILSFIGSIWISSRIYRVGILMYGKKPSFRELVRWVRY